MLKLTVLFTGKAKEPWIDAALQEYTKRLKTTIEITWKWAKTEERLHEWLSSAPSCILLDPHGKLFTSEELSSFLFFQWEKQKGSLSIAIGGAEGFSPEIKARSGSLLSLSPLTFTHTMTRVILLEQIYRALQIHLKTPYHK